ncbi:MAG TPA: response regulator transcription factor [Solirubrobacteraceae bacterium]|nr:response regulator transcription factor [Solirubrobacteraceae bacterium]
MTASGGAPRPSVTVILGEEQAGMRAGVRGALESGGVHVLAEATGADEALAAAIRHRPDVCLLAVHLPGGGIVAAERIKSALPDTKIVMLTESERDEDLFESIHAGADGYLLKDTSATRLPEAIRGVLSGEAAIPRRLVARLIQDYRGRGRRRVLHLPNSASPVEITARESEVVARLREGESTAEIARDLRISEVTARRHISSVAHKLGASNRQTALAMIERADLEVLP